jgi:tetratricopeptide (TPR) repeat protein
LDPSLAIEGCSQLTEAAGIIEEQLAHRANAYGAIGQREQTIADYSRAIALDPDYANAYYNWGRTYLESSATI